MHFPKISIVMPSFNSEKYIAEAIESVIEQNYPNLEFILIDGGSTDNTVAIIKRYEEYLTYWESEADEGHGHALNKGFARATGEIMAWLNSDDKYVPGAFFAVAEVFQQFADVNWLVGKNGWWDKEGNQTEERYEYKNVFDFLVGDYQWIQQESVFWRRTLWEKTGGYINQKYRFMVDGELWTRFFLADELWHLDTRLSGYRMHDTNRAKLHMKTVLAEMEKAVEELRHRVRGNRDIMDSLRKAQSFSEYTDESGFIDYKVITKSAAGWEKRRVNYFLVKWRSNNQWNFNRISTLECDESRVIKNRIKQCFSSLCALVSNRASRLIH